MELFIWLKKNRVNQKKMAHAIGISETTLSKIANRLTSPSLLVALQIQHYTKGKVRWEEMLSEKGEKKFNDYLNRKKKEE